MTAHRALNLALVLLIVYLMAYFGPHLDESACLIGACGLINLSEASDSIRVSDVVALWFALILMAVCTLIVFFGVAGYLAYRMGWL